MKKSKISLCLLVFTSLFLSFTPFISTVYAIDDISYTFENDVFYNQTINNIYDDFNNVRNTTSFTNTFNASYTFTNTSEVPIFLETDTSGIGCSIELLNTVDNHNNILNFSDTSGNRCTLVSVNEASTFGTVELWFRTTDSTKATDIRLIDDVIGFNGVVLGVDNNLFRYWSGASWSNIISASSNEWYHFKIDFECTGGAYLGLAQYTYFVSINNIQYGAFPYYQNAINQAKWYLHTNPGDSNYESYFDAFGYSWLSNYSIGKNIVPIQNTDTNILEVDAYSFTFDSVGNRYPAGTDNPSGWIDVESGADRVNTALNETGYNNLAVQIYSSIGADNDNSLLKDDFNLNSERLNITTGFFLQSFTTVLTRYAFEVKSLANNLVIWIEIRATGNLRWYTSNPPGTYVTLDTGLTTGIYYEFNIYIDYSADIGILMLSQDGIHTDTYINPLTNSGQTGLKSIENFGVYVDGNIILDIDYIGIYNNGSSIAKDLGYTATDLNKTGLSLDSTHNNLATINLSGNFELIYASNPQPPFPTYLLDTNFGSITDGFVVMNNNSRLFNYFDESFSRANPVVVAWLNNGSKGFRFNSIVFEGVKLTESLNTYWLDYSHNNILTNESYFRVDVNTSKLTFNLITDDSNLEFIQAGFNINDISTDDRAVSFISSKNNLAYGELRLLYPSVSDIIKIPNSQLKTRTIISQNKTLTEFIFLFSDNNINALNGITTGFIQELSIIGIDNLSTSIITLTILGMIIPLIMIIIPTLAFSNKLGKQSIIPLFLIFSLIFTITGSIPIWLFFLIGYSGLVYMIRNKNNFQGV